MKDFLGQELTTGVFVAGLYSTNETPALFQICGFTAKKVRLCALSDSTTITSKYPHDLLKVNSGDVSKIIGARPKDKLGHDLTIGDCAFASDGEYIDPVIVKITGFLGDAALIKKVYGKRAIYDNRRLPSDLIKIDPALVTMHLLTKENN